MRESMIWRRVGLASALVLLVGSIAVLNFGGIIPAGQANGCAGGGGSPSPSPSESEGGLPTDILTELPGGGESESPSGSPSPGGSQRCKTKLTIAYNEGSNATEKDPRGTFKGKVKSEAAQCKKARRVIVKKAKKGRDRTIGNTTSNRRGAWRVPSRAAKGRYYAKAPKAQVTSQGTETTCLADRSRTIRV